MATKTKIVKKAKVKGAPKPPATRHRPAARKTPTRLQAQASKTLREAEEGPPVRRNTGERKRKSLASRAKNKIGRKHKILRPLTYLTVGLLVGAGKCTKWTAIGAGKAGKWGGVRLAHKVRTDMRKRKWVPAAPRPSGMSRFRAHVRYSCTCGKAYSSIEALNHHLVTGHRGEAKQYSKAKPKIQRGHRRVTEGKVIVRPAGADGGGRHRARHNLPNARRVAAILAAHQEHLTKIGVAVMAADSAAAAFRRAAKEFADSPRPETLADLTEQCVGMERAGAAISDAIADYSRMLTREADPGDRRGANIDPALVRPFMRAAQEHAENMGREFTRFIAAFQEFYRPEIMAARKKKTPNMDLSKTG
jgi:hypothetical protein